MTSILRIVIGNKFTCLPCMLCHVRMSLLVELQMQFASLVQPARDASRPQSLGLLTMTVFKSTACSVLRVHIGTRFKVR